MEIDEIEEFIGEHVKLTAKGVWMDEVYYGYVGEVDGTDIIFWDEVEGDEFRIPYWLIEDIEIIPRVEE